MADNCPYLNENAGLIVGVRREPLRLAHGNGRAPVYQLGHDSTRRLDTQRKWRNIQQQHIFCLRRSIATQNAALNSGAVGNGFVGIDGVVELLAAEEIAQEGLHLGDAGRPTNEDDFIDL